MRRYRGFVKRLTACGIAVGLMAAGLYTCARMDEMESTYAGYDAVVADGAIHRGWVPPWLPRSATDIHELHNLDTNARWMVFSFDPADARFAGHCSPLRDTFPPMPRKRPRRWWPGRLVEGEPWDAGLEGFNCAEGEYLVVDRHTRKAWFWVP